MFLPLCHSSTRSTSRNGYRCGRYRRMPWISSCVASVISLFLIGAAGGVALQRLEPCGQRVEALEARDQPAPDMGLFERDAPGVYAGAGYGMADHGTAGDHHVVGDGEVSADAD